jgi:hypothetical protein
MLLKLNGSSLPLNQGVFSSHFDYEVIIDLFYFSLQAPQQKPLSA